VFEEGKGDSLQSTTVGVDDASNIQEPLYQISPSVTGIYLRLLEIARELPIAVLETHMDTMIRQVRADNCPACQIWDALYTLYK